jgi:aspartyl/asparaginyl beta-hydroxylase (cupin superfamily)
MSPNLEQQILALLSAAEREELAGRPRAAAAKFRAALRIAPRGFAPSPALAARLDRARRAVDANNRALEDYIRSGLENIRARYEGEHLGRFDQCVETLLQKRRVYRQQPTFLYFPELPAIEFYPRHYFPWLAALEGAADDIRRELLDVLGQGPSALDPYVADPKGLPPAQWSNLIRSRRWGVFALWREGRAYPENIARCPRTVEALRDCPRWDVPGNGPTALFSVLDAKTRIPSHTGPVNTRLVAHLPLIVPKGCGFRVGGQSRAWEQDKAFVFDDSIDHEAWNDGDEPRAVLIFDIWSPFLSEAERELTRALTVRVGEFYGAADAQAGGGGAAFSPEASS